MVRKIYKSIAEHPRMRQIGPGLITGAADDDPSGIATYSQAGAQFGFHMLWTMIFTYPLMVGIQMVSARLGCITGRGLAANVKAVFPRPVLYGIVGLLLVANTINVAADIAAIKAAARAAGAEAIVTTEKDAVKIDDRDIIAIAAEMIVEPEVLEAIAERVASGQ